MLDIDTLIKVSMLNKHAAGLRVFRNLKTDIMNFKTQKNAPNYGEAEELKLIQKYVSRMEDAKKQYSQAGREDLALECREELEVLRELLPAPATAQNICSVLGGWCISNGFINLQDASLVIPKKSMGTAIKAMKEVFPTTDGKMISDIVKQYVI